ncbi:hypothetical protein ABZ027_35290 [Streptomyces sp. NPDC006332]|uniref:hypothetical protein n=1 Tax=Streptomyces sp. NPDC006332 TaxID=3155456 RepID=UPI0033B79293
MGLADAEVYDAPDGYFGETVAAGYDESSAAMFASGAMSPAVDVLVGLADGGRARR